MKGALTGHTTLVTNVANKLGFSLAQHLGAAGAKVFVADRHDQKLRKAVHDLKEIGIKAAGAVVDVAKPEHREKLIQEVEKKYGTLDSLVINNATNKVTGNIMDASQEQFDEMLNNYLKTPFFLTQSALPLLRKSVTPSVVLLASFTGFTPFEEVGLYSMANTGLLGFCKSASLVLAKSGGIRINSVALGMMRGDNSGAYWSTASDADCEALSQLIPLGRIPKSTECASLVEFLVSDRSKYITGENYVVSGGVSVRI